MKKLPSDSNKNKSPYGLVPGVLLVVVIAEVVVYTSSAIFGQAFDASSIYAFLLRLVIVAVGVTILLMLKQANMQSPAKEALEQAVDKEDDQEIQKWPTIDELTRTANERGLTISVLELMALADRYGHKLSIGMIKISGIELLDRSTADTALINMAGIMTESVRLPDRIGRFKEDVFMILLPESDINGAAIVADRIKNNLNQGATDDYSGKVNFSIGMTEFQRGEDLHSLMSRVETAVSDAVDEDSGICIKHA